MPRLAIELTGDRDRLRHCLPRFEASDGGQLLSLGQQASEGEEMSLFRIVHNADVQEPRRVQRRQEVEGPPGNLIIGVDLREVAARALGGELHEVAIPALADADADVMNAVRQLR